MKSMVDYFASSRLSRSEESRSIEKKFCGKENGTAKAGTVKISLLQ